MYYFLFILSFLFSCTSEKKSTKEEPSEIADKNNNIINIDDAFSDIREIRLSEIADSVSFLPLETTQNGLIPGYNFRFSPFFIFHFDGHFDWTGKYIGSIVKRGQGPYEEVEGGSVLFHNNHYYSKGAKLIEYDNTGSPTGKVRRLYESRKFSENDKFRASVEFFSAGKNLAVYNYPNYVHFINTDFEIINSILVSGVDSSKADWNPTGKNYITYYKDKIVFYNFMNDTIFYIADDRLEPQWIVNFNGDQRLSNKALLTHTSVRMQDVLEVIKSGISPDNTLNVKLFDKKHIAYGAFETERNIFFPMQELTPLSKQRGKEGKSPYIVIFDKSSHKTFRVKGDGFVDDLTGLNGMKGRNFFYPANYFYDEKMIHAVWPFEILDFVKESQDAGRAVNPRLLELSKTLDVDDNPILILVHLKRK